MAYKTILVHVDLSPGAPARIRCAAALARRHGAHLVGAAATGLSRFLPAGVLAQAGPAAARRCEQLRREAGEALARFAALAAEEGVASCEQSYAEDETGAALALRARYCDLVVAGKDMAEAGRTAPGDLAAHVLLHCGRPVLVAPQACAWRPGMDVLVGWDGGAQACRAVDGAMPLLRAAARVTILSIGDRGDRGERAGEAAAQRLSAFLGRHGVAASPLQLADRGDPGAALLETAGAVGAGLLVVGAYGHARVREQVLGGVTTTVLEGASLPVLLAH